MTPRTKGPSILQHPDWSIHSSCTRMHLITASALSGRCPVSARQWHAPRYCLRLAISVKDRSSINSTWDLEALAMIWATRLFRMYLSGCTSRDVLDRHKKSYDY
jgi:hypothetical protein